MRVEGRFLASSSLIFSLYRNENRWQAHVENVDAIWNFCNNISTLLLGQREGKDQRDSAFNN